MRSRRVTELGLISLASSLFLALLSFVLSYLWDAVLTRGTVDTILGESVRLVWIPVTYDLLLLGMAVFGLIGVVLLWRGRWDLGPEYAAGVGLALLTMAAAAIAFGFWLATGVLLGYFSEFSGLISWRYVLAFVATSFLGFTLYWLLANLPLHGTRPVAAVAFALGVAGGAISLFARAGLRRPQAVGLDGAATALSLASLVLWFVLCVWGSQSLRSGRPGPPAVAPARGA